MLDAIRLGERRAADQNSLATDAPLRARPGGGNSMAKPAAPVLAWMEIYDYMIDERYRGVILMARGAPCLFVSLAGSTVGKNLKSR
jgi:hypothetical protein